MAPPSTRIAGWCSAPLASLALALIRAYRLTLSPILGPRCRFHPTCSAYALEAITRHGIRKGGLLSARRLARCHPIAWLGGGQGFDPVPGADDAAVTKATHA
jgi:hypothetical protein